MAAIQRLQLDMAATLADIVPWQHDAGTGLLQTTERGWSMRGRVGPPQGLPLATLAALLHPDDPATWRRRVQPVQASSEHLLALIDAVLALSSLESGALPLALEPVALAPLVETSLPLVELLARTAWLCNWAPCPAGRWQTRCGCARCCSTC